MQIALRSAGECFEEHGGKLDVPRSQFGTPWQRHFPDEVRPARQIERAGGARFVHGQGGPTITNEPRLFADGSGDRLSDDESQIFGCVVAVDLDVARRPHCKVDEAVASDLIDHVAQKRQRGVDLSATGSVQIQRDFDGRFLRFSGDRRGPAHGVRREVSRGRRTGSNWCYLLRGMSDVETGGATKLFAGEIDPQERGRLEEHYGRRFGVGETLLEEGAPARHVFLLQEGRVRLLRRVANVERGLSILKRGDLFGEGALRNVPAHASTAVALSDGSLLALDRDGFHALVERHPRLAIPIIERLLYRVRDAEDQIEIMMMTGPETRVTSALLKLASSLTGTAEVAISPLELSTYVGLGLDAVKRIVEGLCERRYLSVRRERIEIADIEALRRLNVLLGTKDDLARRDA